MADSQLNFGDGSPQVPATFGVPVEHIYSEPGAYGVSATAPNGDRGTTRVNGPGTFEMTVTRSGTVTATGATAGTPGTFTPTGAVTPSTGPAIETLTASPASAWTSGEYVEAVNADERYWDGSAWTVGKVPAPPATGATSGKPGYFTPAGCITPATGPDIDIPDIVANPQSWWGSGQYVAAANGDERFWAGSQWLDGRRPPPATGATAGTPGTYTPTGAQIPATGTAIESLAASPLTTWTAGQYVVAANADERFWDGAAWQTGRGV